VSKEYYIKTLIEYIENNLADNLDVENLSLASYVSYVQLYRDFYSAVGHSVKEYIRKRRLSNALALIKTSEFSLADIACQCGFSSQQALCRSVKEKLDMTPLEYKASGNHYFFPPFDGRPPQTVIVSSEIIPKAFCVKYNSKTLKNIENKAVGALFEQMPDYSGRIFGQNGKQNGTDFCYELYLTEKRDIEKLRNFEMAGEIARFSTLSAKTTVPNTEEKINAAWDYLYYTWLPASMFEHNNEPYYEEYIIKNKKPVKLKLYLPVQKREGEFKISLINDLNMRFIISKIFGYNAEQKSSKAIINYLSEYYPYVLKTSKEFFIQKDSGFFAYGIRVNKNFRFQRKNNINEYITENDTYISLESEVMGDYNRYADMLLSFAHNNGIKIEKNDIFMVYDAINGFIKPKTKMYCQIKK
jgi:AraC-like DNA-binding protein